LGCSIETRYLKLDRLMDSTGHRPFAGVNIFLRRARKQRVHKILRSSVQEVGKQRVDKNLRSRFQCIENVELQIS